MVSRSSNSMGRDPSSRPMWRVAIALLCRLRCRTKGFASDVWRDRQGRIFAVDVRPARSTVDCASSGANRPAEIVLRQFVEHPVAGLKRVRKRALVVTTVVSLGVLQCGRSSRSSGSHRQTSTHVRAIKRRSSPVHSNGLSRTIDGKII